MVLIKNNPIEYTLQHAKQMDPPSMHNVISSDLLK